MSLFNLLLNGIVVRSPRCVESLDTAIMESRNDDGSLRFRESIFYRLPMHERAGYLKALRQNRARKANATSPLQVAA